MRRQAGKMLVMFAALVATGLTVANAARAQDEAHKEGDKAKWKLSAEEAHQVAEDRKQAESDARQAAQEARNAAEEAAHQARDIQIQIAPSVVAGYQPENGMATKIRKAAEELRDAKDDAAHEKANAKLRDLLDQYFEEDMTHRQKELESIETRLQKLHAQLDRRRAKKQEIIDLQVKMSVNEADGLGFYSQPEGPVFNFAAPPPGNVFRKGPFRDETITAPSADMFPPPRPVPVVMPVPAPAAPEPSPNPAR
jgi:hypothetical protein